MPRILAPLLGLLLSLPSLQAAEPPQVIPRPASVEYDPGSMPLAGSVPVRCGPGQAGLAGQLRAALAAVPGVRSRVAGPGRGGVSLILDPAMAAPEGYRLQIRRDGAELRARDEAGLLYGVQTLRQLLAHAAAGARPALPCLRIVDQPRFAWRGMHLDVSRHFFPKAAILAYLDVLAAHKLNVFHWHLTDDHGWRLEIKRYPRLTAFAAWREPRDADHAMYDRDRSLDPARRTYGGFYTRADVREVLARARALNITVVPEIEMPGHSMAALDAYPELSCSGRPYVPPAVLSETTEFTDPFCAGNDKTFEFLENVLQEVVDLFPGQYVHVGGDEARKAPWLACPKCQARMAAEGLKDAKALQSWFMRRIERFLAARGRRMIAWDEVLEGGLPATTTVMVWRDWLGDAPLAQSLAQGHPTIATPAAPLYFGLPTAEGLKATYGFDPAPARLGAARGGILGAEGCIWTEEVHSAKELMEVLTPNLCPLAEVLWSGPGGAWDDFARRLDAHSAFLDAAGLDYRVLRPLAQGPCGNASSRQGGYSFRWPHPEE